MDNENKTPENHIALGDYSYGVWKQPKADRYKESVTVVTPRVLADKNVRDPRRVSARDAAAADPQAAHAQSRRWKQTYDRRQWEPDDTPEDVEIGDKPDLLADMTADARKASAKAFNMQEAVARGRYADYDQVAENAPNLRGSAVYMLVQGGLVTCRSEVSLMQGLSGRG